MSALVDPYALAYASLRARLLGFPPDDVEDARQDLLLDYLRRLPKYDRTRGDQEGFVRGVMRNHAAVLAVRRRRHVGREIAAGDLSSESTHPTWTGSIAPCFQIGEAIDSLDLRSDIRRVLATLPPSHRVLAMLLGEMCPSEVCVRIRRSRSRVYQMIRQIRFVFVQAGLDPARNPRSTAPGLSTHRPAFTASTRTAALRTGGHANE